MVTMPSRNVWGYRAAYTSPNPGSGWVALPIVRNPLTPRSQASSVGWTSQGNADVEPSNRSIRVPVPRVVVVGSGGRVVVAGTVVVGSATVVVGAVVVVGGTASSPQAATKSRNSDITRRSGRGIEPLLGRAVSVWQRWCWSVDTADRGAGGVARGVSGYRPAVPQSFRADVDSSRTFGVLGRDVNLVCHQARRVTIRVEWRREVTTDKGSVCGVRQGGERG
jgi:hypothetical protein